MERGWDEGGDGQAGGVAISNAPLWQGAAPWGGGGSRGRAAGPGPAVSPPRAAPAPLRSAAAGAAPSPAESGPAEPSPARGAEGGGSRPAGTPAQVRGGREPRGAGTGKGAGGLAAPLPGAGKGEPEAPWGSPLRRGRDPGAGMGSIRPKAVRPHPARWEPGEAAVSQGCGPWVAPPTTSGITPSAPGSAAASQGVTLADAFGLLSAPGNFGACWGFVAPENVCYTSPGV